MQARTALFSLIAALAVAALAFIAFWPDRAKKREPGDVDGLRAELQETRKELTSMKRTQTLLAAQKLAERFSPAQGVQELDRDRAAENAAGRAPAENGALAQEAMDEETLRRIFAEEEAATVVRYQKLATDLEREPRDSAWANETERVYRDQLETFAGPVRGAKPSIVSLECRTSLCRLELAFENQDDAHQYGGQLVQHPSVQRGTFRHIKTGGEVRTVAFLARGDRTIYPLRPNQAPLTDH